MLLAAAVLDAPDDPSGRGLLGVVAAVLVLALVAAHLRLLLRVVPVTSESPAAVTPAGAAPAAGERDVDRAAAGPSPGPAPAREPVDARRP